MNQKTEKKRKCVGAHIPLKLLVKKLVTNFSEIKLFIHRLMVQIYEKKSQECLVS